ncbi:MAG: alpha-2-macroglobulin family protein, partial [Planctomycetota bacterium]
MQQESLTIRLPAPRATDGPRTLLVETRNIESLKGRFYRIDAVEYFRKHGSLAGLDKVMVEVIAPDGTFEHAVEGYEKFRAIKGEIAIPGLDAGAYIVAVEGGTLRASGLMLVSDLTLITKDSPKGALAFVQEKGRPIGGVTFLARDRKGKVREATSDKEGVAELRFPHSAGSASFLAVHGGSIAHVGAGFSTSAIRGYETRVHISTDRPVYRPGHKVRYRAIVRRASGEFLVTPAGESARITVTDGVGNRLHQLDTKLSEFGTAAGEFELPKDLPPGNRKIVLAYRGRSYSGSFLVEAYRKPQIFLDLVPDRPTFVRGEDVAFEIRARYAFGRPLPGMDLELRAWGTVGKQGSSLLKTTVTTDAEGKARVTIPTHAGPDMRLKITATGIDNTRRRYELQREILVNESAYRASVSVEHDTLFAGETARILLKTFDALGNPVGAEGTIDVGYEVPGSGTSLFPKVASLPVTTGSDGQTRSEYVPGKAGIYLFRFVGVDRAGRKVTANAMVEVVAEDGRVIVRSDVVEYRVGDLARVTVTSPTRDAFALLTFEGEEVYGHRVLRLKQTRNVLEIPIDARFVPDVRIRVALPHNGKLYEGEDQVRVQQRMLLNVRPEKGEYGPGQLCRLFLETTDEAGKALPAEVAVAVVDAAIFLLHPDRAPDLVATFTPPARMDLVQTRSSLDFSYDGVTAAISKDLIEERIRREMKKLEKGLLLEESEMDDAPFEDELGEPSTSIGLGGGAGGGRRGRGGRRNLRAGGGAPGAAAAIDPRRKFEDTAFFAAAIRTGSDGKATVEFTLPDDLTEWRITARGASRANAFGEARSGFLTSRPLVVRSALPRFLREGDELTAAAGIVNGTELQANVLVELTSGLEETLTIAPGDEGVVDWPLPEHEVGLMTLRAKASAEGIGSDIEERKLKVQAYGVDWRTGFAGISTEPGERILHLPHDLAAGTAKLRLQVAPSLAAAALDGIAELRAYPYGCTEQTVNRFYPALEIAAAIKTLGLDKTKLLPGLMKIAQAGALRLTYLQNKEGLWGWWRRGGSDPEMSAYALIALARARKAGVDFSEKTMERARKALPELLKKVRDPDLRAFLLLAQAHAFGADFQQLAPYFADRARLGTRGLAHLALAYEPMGRTSQRKILIEEMGRRRTPPDVETLGWALAAAAGLDSSSALSRDLALRLARHRKGSGFGTTRQTGAAILGLARALEGQGVAPRGMTVNVSINGETVLTEKVPADGRSLSLPVEKLKPGENRVAVTGSGGGTLFYSLLLEGLRKEAPATGGPLTLQRSHALVPSRYSERSAALVKRGGVVREPEVDALRIGELLRVTLTLQSSGQRQLVIQDPLPAGFQPVAVTEKGPFLATHRLDDKMVFFLEAPTEEVAVSYLVQSEA